MATPPEARYHPTMRIACPKCNAAYDVPPAQLAPGRTVRCARCTETWTPVETEDAAPAIATIAETPRPLPTSPQPAASQFPTPEPAVPNLAEPSLIGPNLAEPQSAGPQPADLPPAPFAVPVFGAAPPPTSAETNAAMKARLNRHRPPIFIGWLTTILVLAGLAYVVEAYSGPIIRIWPAAARAYAVFGIGPLPPAPP